jgi:iron complex transport system permease protein
VTQPATEAGSAKWFVLGSLVLAGTLLLSLTVGAVTISVSDVWAWATGQLSDDDLAARVLSGIRLPRSLAALATGAVLGVSGIALQGLHRTRLIDAHLVGISAAAGLGVALGYAAAPSSAATVAAIAAGMAFGAFFAVASRMLGSLQSGTIGLVLIGIASGLALTAWTGLFVLAVDSPAVPSLTFFIFGSMAGVTWTMVAAIIPIALVGIVILWRLGPGLDVLSLGEQTSTHLGFDATTRVPATLGLVGLITGASVAVSGVIGFVGLIVPLLVRPLVGATHRLSIPAAAIAGAILLILLDTAARTLAAPIEIPIGLLSAAIGGPILIWLVRTELFR